eukprot:Lithocolla_globosa_v1_NODE_24_length_9285_cov_66.491832.p8 type:complete len:152 gc:universal NODE_24_length_9285_cov_66.491832:3355-3810(+)
MNYTSCKKETMTSQCIQHVLAYQAEHNVSYKEALKGASKTYKKKQQGKGLSDAISSVADAASADDELIEVLDKGLDFTTGILDSDQRKSRVDKRIDRRDSRATHRQERRQEAKDVKQDRKNEKQKLKKDKITHKREVKQAKHDRKLDRIKG